MAIDPMVLHALGGMSPQQREDLYLTLACHAADRGDDSEADQWLAHAESRTTWQELENIS